MKHGSALRRHSKQEPAEVEWSVMLSIVGAVCQCGFKALRDFFLRQCSRLYQTLELSSTEEGGSSVEHPRALRTSKATLSHFQLLA